MPPVPENVVGLEHWTVNIDGPAIDQLRRRLSDAGVPFEERGEGLLTTDPWGTNTLFTPWALDFHPWEVN